MLQEITLETLRLIDHFHALHQRATPLRLPNIWDAASAIIAQQLGAEAVATSSAAIAWSLGYSDGEQLPLKELLAAIRRIVRVCKVPLTVDLEQGYSDNPHQVAALVMQCAEIGVAGVNLEDGSCPATLLAEKIQQCRSRLAGLPLFINARTDVYLAGLAAGQTAIDWCQQRSRLYQAAGADCLFVPGVTQISTAAAITNDCHTSPRVLPLNLMGWPTGASTQDLQAAHVCRVSMGPALFLATYQQAYQMAQQFIRSDRHHIDLQTAESAVLDYTVLNSWLSS